MPKLSLATLAAVSVFALSGAGCGDSSPPLDGNDDGGVSDAANDATGTPTRDASVDGAKADASHEAGIACAQPTDCPVSKGGCADRTCTNGECGSLPRAAGAASAEEVAGDCTKKTCDGDGALVAVHDDADVPIDGNACTDDRCLNGAPSNPPASAGKSCGTGNTLKCDGAGSCVGCIVATDCAGQDTACQSRTCTAHVCGLVNQPIGTATPTQSAGDCKVVQCNATGSIQIAIDNADVPVDNETCTKDLCTSGVPSNPPEAATVACHEGSGTTCSGTGSCVACNVAGDCPGQDSACSTRTCNGGTCGVAFVAAGTAVSTQVNGDCKKSVCDGAGAVTAQNDDTDIKDDQNPCTTDGCSSGAPTHPVKGDGFVCGTNLECHGGVCTGCGLAGDCPGSDDECKTRTCTGGVCGLNVTATGTLLAAQTSGDCKSQVCDGTGSVKGAVNDADLPSDDGNQCTSETCVSGAPAHPARPVDTACNQNGGAFCGPAATCVACIAASECPGQDNACQTRTCTNNTCGVAFQSAGSTIGSQTPGDCSVKQCDGAGGIVSVEANGDVPPDDGNACTGEVCNAGVPSHPARPINTACGPNGASFCSAIATCVVCNAPTQCAGTDTECHSRTCAGNACGVSNAPAGAATSAQTAGDCRQNQCDGAGNIVNAIANTDVPADDGNQCTSEVCTSGTPGHPSQPLNTACNQGGGSLCNASAVCVQCNAPTQCAGTDTECHSRTCTGNACGVSNAPAGTATSAQTAGDCRQNQCDGAGNIVSAVASSDVPADDGNQCTSETCTSGVAGHPSLPVGSACSQGGGSVCSTAGTCVQCNAAAECPGVDTECGARSCSNNTCGVVTTAAGTATSAQTPGDCQENECDGAGNVAVVVSNADVPADDGNQCTGETCSAGVPQHPNAAFMTPCNQSGGNVCNGSGSCLVLPQVAATTPSDATIPVASPVISVTFTTAMNPATLTAQTTAGACTGSIQVSLDGFASCLALSSASAAMSGGNTTATFNAAPGLLVNRVYKIRVTTAAASATGVALGSQFTLPTGFTTTSPNLCDGSVVISQVYGGGGTATATYKNDFVELHNRGTVAVSLAGQSIQYASGAGTTWAVALLSGTVQPGAYFLVQLGGNSGMANLPPADAIPTNAINMSGTSGKVALINATAAIPNGACPSPTTAIDVVLFGGATGSCAGVPAPSPGTTTSVQRAQSGCAGTANNGSDFTTTAPAPRNSATASVACACVAENESNAALEADFCTVQFPLSMSVQTGTSTPIVYGQIYETGTTETSGPSIVGRAQLGYGPATANPEYEAGWTWTNASYNVQSGNNDEYQASFTAPAVGTYRYAYRMSLDQGVSWTLCDQNSGDGGSGSLPGLTFDLASEPVLIVTP